MEPRIVTGDASLGRRAGVTATTAYTVRGRPVSHWMDGDHHLAVRGGAMARFGNGGSRVDAVLGIEGSWNRVSAVVEAIVSHDRDDPETGMSLAAAAESSVRLHQKAGAFVRLDRDGERSLYSVGAGVSYFATADRRNRISILGWLRRDDSGLSERDGIVVSLQAEL